MDIFETLVDMIKEGMGKQGMTKEVAGKPILDVDRLAERAGVSRAHVVRHFNGTRGKSNLAGWQKLLDAADPVLAAAEAAEADRRAKAEAAKEARIAAEEDARVARWKNEELPEEFAE